MTKFLRFLAPLVLATGAGFGWGDSSAYLIAALLMFLAWGMSTSRLHAFVTVLVYYLVTARGVPFGGAVFFGDAVKPAVIWLGASAILAAVWAAAWTGNWKHYWWRLLAVQLVITLPPLGQLAVGNPLTGAGMLFPGLGFVGYAATFVWGVLLAQHGRAGVTHKVAHAAGLSVLAWMLGALMTYGPAYQPPVVPEFSAVDTQQGATEKRPFFDQFFVYQKNARKAGELVSKGSKLVVLPESSAGQWGDAAQGLWSGVQQAAQANNAVVVTGATLTKAYPADNVMVVMDGADTKLYTVRVSVPFRGSDLKQNLSDFGASISGTGIVETKTGKLGMFICYEVLLPWPVLTTAYQHPNVLVAGINGWWAPEGNSIPGLQRSVLQSWASLFGVPGVAAINR